MNERPQLHRESWRSRRGDRCGSLHCSAQGYDYCKTIRSNQ